MSWLRFGFQLLAAVSLAQGAEFKLRWRDGKVEAQGFSARQLQRPGLTAREWQRVLAIYAEQSDALSDMNLPPVAGSYRVEKGTLVFEPKFPLTAGVTYNAVLRPDALGIKASSLTASHRLDAPRIQPSTVVSAIYPSADTVPENLLKFYIHFSAPMSGGRIYEHIHLRDASRKDLELPFLEIDEELWNPEMTRLTLFLDPGRIKRGVRPLEEIGPSFVAGRKYALTIAATWLDATGAQLQKDFTKTFAIAEADREPPDPAKWRIQPPAANTRDPLRLVFNEPMDHGIAARTILVFRSDNSIVSGEVRILDQERIWSFTPEKAWATREFYIQVPGRIEDLAGNYVGKPFDVDLEASPRRLAEEKVRLPFQVR